jgi:hypothetical protein
MVTTSQSTFLAISVRPAAQNSSPFALNNSKVARRCEQEQKHMGIEMQTPARQSSRQVAKSATPLSARIPSIIVGLVMAAIATLSIFYLLRPQPLLVQGEVDATRFDIAARVDGRVADIPVERGQNVAAGAVLVRIDNPETTAKHALTLAAKAVAEAQLANGPGCCCQVALSE